MRCPVLLIVALLLRVGVAPAQAGDPDAARWEWALRLSVQPDLGEQHLRAGRYLEAKAAYEEALALCPEQNEAVRGLSHAKLKLLRPSPRQVPSQPEPDGVMRPTLPPQQPKPAPSAATA